MGLNGLIGCMLTIFRKGDRSPRTQGPMGREGPLAAAARMGVWT
jgi:hypothetical protein